MSTFAIFSRDGKCLSEGKSEQEAYDKACETLAAVGITNDRVYARIVEYVRGDQDSHEIVLYPRVDEHPVGQSG